ncbi:metallophosphoesterase [Ruegeria sp. ANG-R]|uniref:metallophosphoesterase family protein n=1 Tax=Ruegeria sp. ANG-R TaxID=1577903 RepID=UPI0005804FD1|nr:metallophosphoesterase family protein [Ruegeria sp. ANG-R]KIC40558.1 metallophosphoesterase [Ruegeria sp. ANG-R]
MLSDWIKRLVAPKAQTNQAVDLSTLAPAEKFYAIGDIHGRLDLLQTLLPALDDDCPLVFVGDYVDRGGYSAHVLRQLRHLSTGPEKRAICLKGNHEDMLLGFLNDPRRLERVWLHNGGAQTLASFGLANTDLSEPETVAEQLQQAMGQPLLEWLLCQPLTWSSGNVTVVHAALDPSQEVDKQHARTCLWGHPRFPEKRRKDGRWVVHGHTIVDTPQIKNDVISIDTGAFLTDQLTAAEISTGTVRFISAGRTGIAKFSV